MGLFDFLKSKRPEAPYRDSVLWDMISSISGGAVNEKTVLGVACIFGALRVRGNLIAGLPIHLYDGDKRTTKPTALNNLLKYRVSDGINTFNFIQAMQSSADLHGDAYAQIVRNQLSEPLELVKLPNFSFRGMEYKGAKLFYQFGNAQYQSDEILHIKGVSVDGMRGLPLTKNFKTVLGIAINLDRELEKFFENGCASNAAATTDAKLTKDQLVDMRKLLKEEYSGVHNAGKLLFFDNGVKISSLRMSNKDADTIAFKKQMVNDVCAYFGLTPDMLGDFERATYANSEQGRRTFFQLTALPLIKNWETELNIKLISDTERAGGLFVKFNEKGLLRADTTAQKDYYAAAITNGWMSRNEVRECENLPPYEGGDEFLTPLNMTTEKQKAANGAG